MGSSRSKVNWMALRKDYERREGSSLGSMRRIAMFEGTGGRTSSRGSQSRGSRSQPIRPLVKPQSRSFARPFRGTPEQHRRYASDVSVEARAALRDVKAATARTACGEAIYDLVRASTYVGAVLAESTQAGGSVVEGTEGLDRELNEAMSGVVKACVKPGPRGMFSGKKKRVR